MISGLDVGERRGVSWISLLLSLTEGKGVWVWCMLLRWSRKLNFTRVFVPKSSLFEYSSSPDFHVNYANFFVTEGTFLSWSRQRYTERRKDVKDPGKRENRRIKRSMNNKRINCARYVENFFKNSFVNFIHDRQQLQCGINNWWFTLNTSYCINLFFVYQQAKLYWNA